MENNVEYVAESDVLEIKKNMDMKVVVPCDKFGDASAGDVATGKTFTSVNGLRLTGTLNSGNVHTATLVIPKGRMRGDVNYDGVVDEKDAEPIRNHINGIVKLEGEDLEAADADASGIVNVGDVTRVSMVPTKKYKLYNTSNDLKGNWTMRDEFIADPTLDYDWIFSTTVTVPGITPTSTVKITPKNFAEVTKCGMNSHIELGDGCITFYTLRPPTQDVECMIEFFEAGDGSVVFVVLPNEREVKGFTAKNILDGLAEGSLRTEGSKFENNGYFMGEYAFAEGYETQARGNYSHAEGFYTSAYESSSHAEGIYSMANGRCSHVEGSSTQANSRCSHAEGDSTIATGDSQHVQGKYNIEDTENKYAHIVGNGSSSNRSNAHTLDWSGNAQYAGKVTVGASPTEDMDVATKQYVDNAIAEVLARIGQ